MVEKVIKLIETFFEGTKVIVDPTNDRVLIIDYFGIVKKWPIDFDMVEAFESLSHLPNVNKDIPLGIWCVMVEEIIFPLYRDEFKSLSREMKIDEVLKKGR